MRNKNARISREGNTVAVMIALYCRKHHLADGFCTQCKELLEYANERLEKCPFGERKTTCARCPVHCYRLEMRQRIRAVMRYSGPRMIYKHPVMAIRHLMDGQRKEPLPIAKK
ncbi:MAG: nitrous oxide-stimulated promoter family protein [Dehalococcoidales bacterium]|nr:nitrous oxide-stimulated promoter family protein [Dehalococcoidales bacterium]